MNEPHRIGSFKVPGHSTKREWAVYLIVARHKQDSQAIKIYVGKTGDNREGCNPVISRVGNHFSFNKIHSQIRNEIKNTEDYDYEYVYCHFGEYQEGDNSKEKDRINELERRLNKKLQDRIGEDKNIDLVNTYKGKYISKKEKVKRKILVNTEDENLLDELIENALKVNQ